MEGAEEAIANGVDDGKPSFLVCTLIALGAIFFVVWMYFHHRSKVLKKTAQKQHEETRFPELSPSLKNVRLHKESHGRGITIHRQPDYKPKSKNTTNRKVAKLYKHLIEFRSDARVIQFPNQEYSCGDHYTEFTPQNIASSDAYFTYQMFGEYVQATWHYDNGKKVLAGFGVVLVKDAVWEQYSREVLVDLIVHCVNETKLKVVKVEQRAPKETVERDLALVI